MLEEASMRSEKEIDDMIAKLSAAESPSMSAAIMALMWVRGDDICGMLRSAMEKSSEALRAYWANPTYSFSGGIRSANAGAVCAHSNIRFEDGKAICESCGEALKLVKVPSSHAPATPPPEG